MKQFLVMVSLVFATGAASAGTTCSITGSTNRDSTFDQILYTAKIESPQMIVLRESGTKAEAVDFKELKTFEQWQALDNSPFISLAPQENGEYAITVGKIDLSKSENATPTETVALGNVLADRPLTLALPSRGLSVSCFNLP